MIRRKASRSMSNERFAAWFEDFKEPYRQTKFIHSYKSLENPYSELVIRHLLTFSQKTKVQRFLNQLPKMSRRRFHRLLKQLKQDSSMLYRYSAKDFTRAQRLIIRAFLLRSYLKNELLRGFH